MAVHQFATTKMLAQVTRATARVLRAPGARALSAEAPTGKKSLLFAQEGDNSEPQARKEQGKAGKGSFKADKQDKQDKKPRARKEFAFAKAQKEPERELEVFEYPAYWAEDFPEGFDDDMKHEVEKLQVFADFAPLLDDAWEQQIHPQFDGAAIKMTLNCPLEDFDERIFVDDNTTYDTKVVMEVPLTCFKGLDKQALDVVKQLAGPRYNANKKHIKLTEDRYPTRVFNHKRLCDILHDLTATALEVSAKASNDSKVSA